MDENITMQPERSKETEAPVISSAVACEYEEPRKTEEAPSWETEADNSAYAEEPEGPVRRRKWNYCAAACLAAVIVAVVGAVAVEWGIPAYHYKQAADHYSMGEYEAAQTMFAELGDYRDSASRLAETERMLLYIEAQSLYDAERFLVAYEKFKELGNFLDSADMADKACHMSKVADTYKDSTMYYDHGYLQKAYETLLNISKDGYRDTAERIEGLKAEMLERAQQHARKGELRSARWYLEYLEEESYAPAAGVWDQIKVQEKMELDYSYYDLKDEPISRYGTKTTQEDFATLFLHMFLTGKIHASISASGVYEHNMDELGIRLWDGYDIASECLPEYGTVYQDGQEIYWSYGSTISHSDVYLDYNRKYSKEELSQHIETIKVFCEESVRNLNEAGLLGKSMSHRQKAKIIYDWVSYYLTYDDTKEIHNAAVAIDSKIGVCESYVGIYNRMCNLAGVPSYGQLGDTDDDDSERHIWSIQMDEEGHIFYTDVTWGDNISLNFADSSNEPTVEDFYNKIYRAAMDSEEKSGFLILKTEKEIVDDVYWTASRSTDLRYFWQEKLWPGHVEERDYTEIIACEFHNAAEMN